MSISHISTCKLCPPEKPVRIVADEMPEIMMKAGEAPPESVARYVRALMEHVQKKHPEAFGNAQILAQSLIALVILENFQVTDPGVENGRDLLRNFFHRLTRKNYATETDLQIRYERIDGFLYPVNGDAPTVRDAVVSELKDLRDFLLEEGQYAPVQPDVRIVSA